jgi:hypothetical protein
MRGNTNLSYPGMVEEISVKMVVPKGTTQKFDSFFDDTFCPPPINLLHIFVNEKIVRPDGTPEYRIAVANVE